MRTTIEVSLDPSLETNPFAQRILRGLEPLAPVFRDDLDSLSKDLMSYTEDPWGKGKTRLRIRSYPGHMVKKCPGTRGHICCGYKVINLMTNCPLDCSYCILQTYLNSPLITIYPELDKVFHEIKGVLKRHPHRFFRFGTGELGDSLAFDEITGFSEQLISFFASTHNGIFELKTKTSCVNNLLNLDHKGMTVVSWSLSTPTIVRTEEHRTAPLEERLQAAQLCHDAGYPVGFHFDPLIHYPGWKEDYGSIVDLLFRYLDPRRVIWISLGGLRYHPSLKQIIQRRFPDSRVPSGELIIGEDGKFRYIKPIRVEMYRTIYSWLKAYNDDLLVYLCMERDDVWQDALGTSPKDTRGLNRRFEERISHFMESRS